MYGEKIRKRLRWVVMAAVACVYNGYGRVHGSHQRRALLGVAHGDYIAVTAYGADGVRHAFALGG